MTMESLNHYYTAIMREVAAGRDWRRVVQERELAIAEKIRDRCAECVAPTSGDREAIRELDVAKVLKEGEE